MELVGVRGGVNARRLSSQVHKGERSAEERKSCESAMESAKKKQSALSGWTRKKEKGFQLSLSKKRKPRPLIFEVEGGGKSAQSASMLVVQEGRKGGVYPHWEKDRLQH